MTFEIWYPMNHVATVIKNSSRINNLCVLGKSNSFLDTQIKSEIIIIFLILGMNKKFISSYNIMTWVSYVILFSRFLSFARYNWIQCMNAHDRYFHYDFEDSQFTYETISNIVYKTISKMYLIIILLVSYAL